MNELINSVDLTKYTPVRDGYTFVGWFKDVDDTTTEYKSGNTYTEDVTYTAKWIPREISVDKVDKVDKVNNVAVFKTKEETIELKWDKVENASGYEVYKYDEGTNGFVKIASVEAGVLSYEDTRLNPDKEYIYPRMA